MDCGGIPGQGGLGAIGLKPTSAAARARGSGVRRKAVGVGAAAAVARDDLLVLPRTWPRIRRRTLALYTTWLGARR